jgi:Rieske Fe-S protein
MAKRTTINCLQVLNQVDGLLSEQFEMQELGDTEDRLYTKPNHCEHLGCGSHWNNRAHYVPLDRLPSFFVGL